MDEINCGLYRSEMCEELRGRSLTLGRTCSESRGGPSVTLGGDLSTHWNPPLRYVHGLLVLSVPTLTGRPSHPSCSSNDC
jgi:hypothetical protein